MPDPQRRPGSRRGPPPPAISSNSDFRLHTQRAGSRSTPTSPAVTDQEYHASSRKGKQSAGTASAVSPTSAHSTPPASPDNRTEIYSRTRSFPLNPAAPTQAIRDDEEATVVGSASSIGNRNARNTGRRRAGHRGGPQDGMTVRDGHAPREEQAQLGVAVPNSPAHRSQGAPRTENSSNNDTDSAPLPEINIAVFGAARVGKSTFVHRAFDLPQFPSSAVNIRKMSLDGIIYLVRLFELDYDDLEVQDDCELVSWPETVDETPLPRIDGALALYDVTNQRSLAKVPVTLSAMHKFSIPCVLVPCKCDNHPANRQVDPVQVEQKAKSVNPNVDSVQTARSVPQSQKQCMSVIIRAIITGRVQDEDRDMNSGRPRALTHDSVRSPLGSRQQSHARARSEHSLVFRKEREDEQLPKSATSPQFPPEASSSRGPLKQTKSFLNLDDLVNGDPMITPKATKAPVIQQEENGRTFAQLVDRLVSQPVSKSDYKFPTIFLALYRKFASPSDLLDDILERFNKLQAEEARLLTRFSTGLRYFGIIERWAANFPEDFSRPNIRRTLQSFLKKHSMERIYAVSIMEINIDVEVYLKDDNEDWPFHDDDPSCPMTPQAKPADGTDPTPITRVTGLEDPSADTMDEEVLLERTKTSDTRGFRSSSGASSNSSRSLLHGIESAQRQSKLLVPNPRHNLTKIQWHQFMDIPDDSIAKKLTLIDWLMFSSIRPRDLVRHVATTAEERKQNANLQHVDRMIAHFNHIAYWVANIVLLRDKPAKRAMMLEKLMRVARKLRELNNYNALGAVLAGIANSAVHRLSVTRDLITPSVATDFLKLELLMAPKKSHFAYRLAWENSSSERIPYLPLHLRDLATAEQNPTFFPSGAINWKKFEIIGEVIVSLQKAQLTAYEKFPRNDEIRPLLLETKLIKDEDELVHRSQQLEPTGGRGGSRRLNEFFRR